MLAHAEHHTVRAGGFQNAEEQLGEFFAFLHGHGINAGANHAIIAHAPPGQPVRPDKGTAHDLPGQSVVLEYAELTATDDIAFIM